MRDPGGGAIDQKAARTRDQLVALATALLKAESLDEREILEVTGLGSPAARAARA